MSARAILAGAAPRSAPTGPARNYHDQMLDMLACSILSGEYAIGAALPPEAQLCEAFGVSRTVVREVVKSLVAKGLLRTGPKVGTKVQPTEQWNWFDADVVRWQTQVGLSHRFLRDLQELRRVVEPAAAALAAERSTAEDVAGLEAAFAGMWQAIHDGGDYVAHDLQFHQRLLQACHNRMVAQMGNALSALLRASFQISTARPNGAAASMPLHRDVLDAVIDRDPQRAEQASRVLIDAAGQDIQTVLATRRRPLRMAMRRP